LAFGLYEMKGGVEERFLAPFLFFALLFWNHT